MKKFVMVAIAVLVIIIIGKEISFQIKLYKLRAFLAEPKKVYLTNKAKEDRIESFFKHAKFLENDPARLEAEILLADEKK